MPQRSRSARSGQFVPAKFAKRHKATTVTETTRRKVFPKVTDKCVGCGCTTEHACDGGCSWITPGVCSRCFNTAVKVMAVISAFIDGTVTIVDKKVKRRRK